MSNMFDYQDIEALCDFAEKNFKVTKDIDYLIKYFFGALDALRRKKMSDISKGDCDGKKQSWYDRRIMAHKQIIRILVDSKRGNDE